MNTPANYNIGGWVLVDTVMLRVMLPGRRVEWERKPLRYPVHGVIVGRCIRHTGVYDGAHLRVEGTYSFCKVATGWYNTPLLVATDDLHPVEAIPPSFPLRYTEPRRTNHANPEPNTNA
jgi:hypothetical protein